ncbi:hypothetical protein BJX68DRAFT_261852 [Aspergillus pseudodeflectus]|uniref:F-box domain-containing protein n=1 Tax=Aspergillus pseudodeflectus TaxID=176178 RepID=A0ABR4L4E7_9EURO
MKRTGHGQDRLSPTHSCPLCGVFLYPDALSGDHIPPRPPFNAPPAPWPTHRRPWFTEVRALVAQDVERGNIFLTGVGVATVHLCVKVPLKKSQSYRDDPPLERLYLNELPYHPGPVVIAFHDACWRILLNQLKGSVAEGDIITLVFHQLHEANRTWQQSDLGLDYGQTFETREAAERADPFEIPSLEEIECAAPSTLTCFARDREEQTTGRTSNPFHKLSAEVLHEVISYLSINQLSSVRLACQRLLSATKSLPQSYWRRQFAPGHPADFLAADLGIARDWCRLYFGVQFLLREGCPTLANRRRIRKVIEPIATTVEVASALTDQPSGLALRPLNPQNIPYRPEEFQLDVSLLHDLPPFVQPVRYLIAERAGEDFRILFHRVLVFNSEFHSHGGRLGATLVQIGTRRYISGVKLFTPGEDDTNVQQIGFPMPMEESMHIPSNSSLRAVEVAFRPEGLMGVRFIFKNSANSPWFGQHSGEGITRGILDVPVGQAHCSLLLGFDRFKIVSLGFNLFSNSPLPENHPAHLEAPEALDIQNYLWMPHPPLHEDTTFGPILPAMYDKVFGPLNGPLCNIDFGGPGGHLLSKLTRMVFYMESMARPFSGVECQYLDQTTRCFGTTTKGAACEISFLIDGPAGERISHVNLLVSPRIGMAGLQLSTNHGRSASFGTIQSRLESGAISLPEIPDGEVITGFVASRPQGHSPSGFARIGIQSQRRYQSEPATTPPNNSLYRPYPIPPEEEAQLKSRIRSFVSGRIDYTYHTHAPLAALKRITSSIGIPGLSRSEKAICGMKLEYHDNTPTVILGQWFQEHTAYDVLTGETVRSLGVYYWHGTEEKRLNGVYKPTRKTTVEVIRIETSTSRSLIFIAPDADLASLEERQVHFWQPHAAEEHGVHDPTTLAWELNADTDALRATCPSCTPEMTRYRPSPELLANKSR